MSTADSRSSGTSNGLLKGLRESPATLPALAGIALFVAWAGNQGGYPVTHWAPGGLLILVLLAMALANVPLRLPDIPVPVRIALGSLVGYTALSYCSILWAQVPGAAWEGANRTLLYLLVFCLFALWRLRGAAAALLLGAWTLALIAMALYVALHIDTASAGALQGQLPGGRLVYPGGYANANAAQWLMAFWPALFLVSSDRLHWALRGALAGGAVLLAGVALLSQSSGSLYATPVMLILVFLLVPGRLRTFATLVPVALGIGLSAPLVLRVGDRLDHEQVNPSTLHTAIAAILLASFSVAVLVALVAAFESKRRFSQAARARVRRGAGIVAIAAVLAVLGGGLVVAGNPIARVHHGWETFKGGYGADSSSGSRLVSGLGSNRYDFYRVALDEFLAHPLLGIGVDNFQQQYLKHGHSEETPRYPHSVELRTLVETGLVGALLALGGLGAALFAGARSLRSDDPLVRIIAAGALAGFAYWAVHGSFDWFWEFAGLGAPAFALLGIACALSGGDEQWSFRGSFRIPRPVSILGLTLFGLLSAASLAAPWLSQRQIQQAAHVWVRQPQRAYALLNGAARLDPLSEEPYLVAGSIALRFGESALADRDFSRALDRGPENAYATLERGAIASAAGRSAEALALLRLAAELSPRDKLAREALGLAQGGERIDVRQLNRLILAGGRELL